MRRIFLGKEGPGYNIYICINIYIIVSELDQEENNFSSLGDMDQEAH